MLELEQEICKWLFCMGEGCLACPVMCFVTIAVRPMLPQNHAFTQPPYPLSMPEKPVTCTYDCLRHWTSGNTTSASLSDSDGLQPALNTQVCS